MMIKKIHSKNVVSDATEKLNNKSKQSLVRILLKLEFQ
jgi:hypothetical protein